MNFIDAMNLVREGKRVKCGSWADGAWVYAGENSRYILSTPTLHNGSWNQEKPYDPTFDEIFAEDWQEVQP